MRASWYVGRLLRLSGWWTDSEKRRGRKAKQDREDKPADKCYHIKGKRERNKERVRAIHISIH